MRTFEVDGLTFGTIDGAIGFDGPGPMAAREIVAMARAWGMRNIDILDLCCGVGVVGILVAHALGPKVIRSVTFADINVFNVRCADYNARKLLPWCVTRTRVSDALWGLHPVDVFDLVVAAPPHNPNRPAQWEIATDHPEGFTASLLGGFDPDWSLHLDIYMCAREHMMPGAVMLLQERTAFNAYDVCRALPENGHGLVTEKLGPSTEDPDNYYWLQVTRT